MLPLTVCAWETAALDRAGLRAVEQRARAHREAAVVATCQRVEVYTTADCDCPAPVRLCGFDALFHLTQVAAGLYAIVLGEEQVVGQVRTALAAAPGAVRRQGDAAIAAARELRRREHFTAHTGHLLDHAFRLGGVPPGGRLLITGTGHVARLVAARARALGFDEVVIAGRRRPEAAWFREGAYQFVALGEARSLGGVDVIAGALGAEAPEVELGALPAARRLVVDLGTPRNFSGRATAPLVDIAMLLEDRARSGAGHGIRARLRNDLRAILERRLAMAAVDATTPAGRLRAIVEDLRRRELQRAAALHPGIPPETLDRVTAALVNKLFHAPSVRLQEADPQLAEAVVALFSWPGSGAVEPPAEAGDRSGRAAPETLPLPRWVRQR